MVDHSTAKIYLDENGIIRFEFKKNAIVELEHAYEYVDIINQLAAGEKRPFILDTRNTFATVTSENRQFMGNNPEALKWRLADALLVDAIHTRILANFYMRIDTPNHPVKLFNDEKKAINWLKQF